MRYAILALFLASCGAYIPPAPGTQPVLPSDRPTRPLLIGDGRMQCSAVMLNQKFALTAKHCTPDGEPLTVLANPPVGVEASADHPDEDVSLLMAKNFPGPYAPLGPYPNPGETDYVEGYGCDRAVKAMPQYGYRPVTFVGREQDGGLVFEGRVCLGDSGGGVYNSDGELLGILSLHAEADGKEYAIAVPIQFLGLPPTQ